MAGSTESRDRLTSSTTVGGIGKGFGFSFGFSFGTVFGFHLFAPGFSNTGNRTETVTSADAATSAVSFPTSSPGTSIAWFESVFPSPAATQ